MANEFVARNGIVARDTSTISGSLLISGSIGTGTPLPNFTLDVLGSSEFIGNMLITGSTFVSGNLDISGSITSTSSTTGQSILGTGLIVNNTSGISSINDFEVKTQLYDAINVISNLNSITLMSNSNGKIGFFGATPTSQSVGWNITNLTSSKSFDADTVTLSQLADTVGTLVMELKLKGILG